VEKNNGVVTSDRRFIWCGLTICEERDSTGAVVRRFFSRGVQDTQESYFYTRDHLGSVRELSDSSGVLRARYDYDPYGRATKISGEKDSRYTFTGHFQHLETGLVLAPFRAYDAEIGRWLSRDPIGLIAGANPYAYANGGPVKFRDPLGLQTGVQEKTLVDTLQIGFEYVVEEGGKNAVTGAGTAALYCLAVLALLCQTGDGHGPDDPQEDPEKDPEDREKEPEGTERPEEEPWNIPDEKKREDASTTSPDPTKF